MSWLTYADTINGEVHRQQLNIQAIMMFVLFVGATPLYHLLGLQTHLFTQDYYTAGGRITGL
ncbi:hypothetical protein M5G07_05785 [Serratia symbiotica]|nr:hypothetical protein [Serratia symbiotica]